MLLFVYKLYFKIFNCTFFIENNFFLIVGYDTINVILGKERDDMQHLPEELLQLIKSGKSIDVKKIEADMLQLV